MLYLSDRVSAAWAHMGDSVDLCLTAACFKSQPDPQLFDLRIFVDFLNPCM